MEHDPKPPRINHAYTAAAELITNIGADLEANTDGYGRDDYGWRYYYYTDGSQLETRPDARGGPLRWKALAPGGALREGIIHGWPPANVVAHHIDPPDPEAMAAIDRMVE